MLEALARTAGLFARTAPSLRARETLEQHGRRGDMQILKRGRNHELKEISFQLPESFEDHEVVSDYSLGPIPGVGGFHELRKTLMVDKLPPSEDAKPRHSMTLGSDEDGETRKKLLEGLELDRLAGAATDFGPLLLLFTEARQRDTRFTPGVTRNLAGNAVLILKYRQTAGTGSLAEFRNSREVKHMPEGEIWFREQDLLPVRITLNTEEQLAPRYVLRNEAEVEYQPTKFGLAPHSVTHRQFLNEQLLVENQFRYSAYSGIEIQP